MVFRSLIRIFAAETIKLMKKLLSIILLAFVSMTVLAQKEQATSLPPLVYEQENTGCHYPKPALPDAGLLPEIHELPNALQGVSSFSDWERRRHEIGTLIQHYGIGEKPVAPWCRGLSTGFCWERIEYFALRDN